MRMNASLRPARSNETSARVQRGIKNPDIIAKLPRSFDEFKQDVEFLAANHQQLAERFPDEWIAIVARQVVAHSRRRSEITRRLKSKGLLDKSPVIEFLSSAPPNLIL